MSESEATPIPDPGHNLLRGRAIDDWHNQLFFFFLMYTLVVQLLQPSYCEQHKQLILFNLVSSSDTRPLILCIGLKWKGATTWRRRVN